VYCGDSARVGPGSPAAAMARSHWTGGPAAVECRSALGALSGGAGHAAWGDHLDLAHPQSLSTRAGQPLVACLRARLLPVHRLAVLVVNPARESEASPPGADGQPVDADAHRPAGCPADLCQHALLWRIAGCRGSTAGRPDHVGAGRFDLPAGRRLDHLALA